jgi:hypothetical protein
MFFHLGGLSSMLFSLEAQRVRAGEFGQREGWMGGGGLEVDFLEVMRSDMGLT